jgi:hypothetical protein
MEHAELQIAGILSRATEEAAEIARQAKPSTTQSPR